MIPPKEIPLKNPPSPKELECLGFKLGNMDLNFKKGYMEVNFGYKKVKYPSNPRVCEKFLEYIRRGPQEFLKGAQEVIGMKSDPGNKYDPESVKERLQEKFSAMSEKIAKDFADTEEMQVEL